MRLTFARVSGTAGVVSEALEGLRKTQRSVVLSGPSVIGLFLIGTGEAEAFALVAQGHA